jgi:alpha-L-fucosidase
MLVLTAVSSPPAYLDGYESTYETSPREAAIEWFEDAKYGLFLHYGLYSLLGNHEWVQYNDRIPPAEYARLKEYFTADGFDAEAIVELAREAEMEYVNVTAKHHDSFCLWDTDETTFNSVEAPAGRDLIRELAEACHDAGVGLFLYYSHGRDWRHPHAPNNGDWKGSARPEYETTPGTYTSDGHDLDRYLDFVESQILELLNEYEPIAGIWLDGWSVPESDPDAFRLSELYDRIWDAQPQTLISYKWGLTGTEDFAAPEHEALDTALDKPGEICTTMIPSAEYEDDVDVSWGYLEAAAGKHKGPEEVWSVLGNAWERDYNLLLNTGPLPDGSIDPEDAEVMRAVGDRIRQSGLPGGET